MSASGGNSPSMSADVARTITSSAFNSSRASAARSAGSNACSARSRSGTASAGVFWLSTSERKAICASACKLTTPLPTCALVTFAISPKPCPTAETFCQVTLGSLNDVTCETKSATVRSRRYCAGATRASAVSTSGAMRPASLACRSIVVARSSFEFCITRPSAVATSRSSFDSAGVPVPSARAVL